MLLTPVPGGHQEAQLREAIAEESLQTERILPCFDERTPLPRAPSTRQGPVDVQLASQGNARGLRWSRVRGPQKLPG
jgi:hypothetical protein